MSSPREKTKLCVIVNSKTPIILKVTTGPYGLSLGEFKRITSLHGEGFKYYFKSIDNEFGVVKEELSEDDSIIPCDKNRIVAWVLTNEGNQTSLFGRTESLYTPSESAQFSDSPRASPNNELQSSRCQADSPMASGAIYIDVQIFLDDLNFLGLTLVGHVGPCKPDHKGIFIKSIVPGSAADIDGRARVGDKIVEVNGISLRNTSTDEAAAIFKNFVEQRGLISMTLRRPISAVRSSELLHGSSPKPFWNNTNHVPSHQEYPRMSPHHDNERPVPFIRPVKPVPIPRKITTSRPEPLYNLPKSLTPRSLYTSSNYDSWVPSSNSRLPLDSRSMHGTSQSSSLRKIDTTLHCAKDDIYTVYAAIKSDADSLDIKDREWLKVVVKDAFLGSSLIKWLSRNVYGFNSRSEIKSYANRMLSLGLIRGPISNSNFSGKCYYSLS